MHYKLTKKLVFLVLLCLRHGLTTKPRLSGTHSPASALGYRLVLPGPAALVKDEAWSQLRGHQHYNIQCQFL